MLRCKHPQEVKWSEAKWRNTYWEAAALRTSPDMGLDDSYFAIDGAPRGMCGKHARRETHRRIRAFVFARDNGRCVIPHGHLFPCSGAWQPNHGFDRDEKSVTYAEWNVMGGCSGINKWAHHNHDRWHEMLRQMWGAEVYEERRQLMLHGPPMEVAEVLAKYPQLAKEETE